MTTRGTERIEIGIGWRREKLDGGDDERELLQEMVFYRKDTEGRQVFLLDKATENVTLSTRLMDWYTLMKNVYLRILL